MPFDHPLVKDNILDAIGQTPLVKLNRVREDGAADIYVKCEFMNPAGSIKDRMAHYIISRAEQEGLLKPGGVIVENTSGNTGAGAAMVAAAKGYRAVFTMPDKMSKEKIDALKAFGAEVIITPTDVPGDSPDHYVNVAKRIAKETPGSFYMDQYHTAWNIEAHYHSTGAELFEQTDGGKIDAICIGTGTGGTVSGVGRYFKEHGSACKIIGVDPLGSVHYSIFKTGHPSTPYVYKVEGLGEDIVCRAFDPEAVDDMIQVDDYQCFTVSRRLTREEGLYCGGSSGGMVHAAMQVARELGPGKTVVAILPDSAGRYLTKYLSDEWMKDHGFLHPDKGLGLIEDVVAARPHEVITIEATATLGEVIAVMEQSGVSQIPVTTNGSPSGIVHEIDILRGLQTGRVDSGTPVGDIANELWGVVHPKSRLEELFPIFDKDQAAIVVTENKVVAVLSQIDLIDYMAKRPAKDRAGAGQPVA